jgi:predicted metalloprotease with PDZ domain
MRRLAQSSLVILLFCAAASAAPVVDYTITLTNPREHVVNVRMHIPPTSAEREVQLPVWNGLYQIRDFVQNIRGVHAHSASAGELPITKVDKSTWRISGAQGGVDLDYEAHLDQAGPFGAQVNGEHAFFNFALLLMYPTDGRDWPVTVTFHDLPSGWRIATILTRGAAGSEASTTFSAPNYDRLVDSPVEISGSLREASFEQDGAVYRVAVHAEPADYHLEKILDQLRRLVASAVAWMDDRPYSEYLFIYHFPHSAGGGGMEHAYSTAIDISAERLGDDPDYFAQVSAHEFFHLWNVKRIRPASLEPIDYMHENYTRALWFSEGVTSTASTLILVGAGLLDEKSFLREFEREIRALQLRPAHSTQSAEEASLDTWLDKYPAYKLPERSISYYNKGELLGFLLDLEMRRASKGSKTLRDLFRSMNQNYAHKARYFADSEGVRQTAEALTGSDFRHFFEDYVAGVQELPYNELLATVGLRLQNSKHLTPMTGFESVRNFDSPPVIVTVYENSEAERVGLVAGDTILEINGKQAAGAVDEMIATRRPGEIIKFRVEGSKGSREVRIKLGARQEDDFKIVEADRVTSAQRARRAAWLASEPEAASAAAGK